MTELLPSVLVETNEQPDAAIIWLHGLGSDGHDFESLVPALSLLPTLKVRFVFPLMPHVVLLLSMVVWRCVLGMTSTR